MIEYKENNYRERERPPTDTGQTWAKKLISILWNHFTDVRKVRCDKRHELDINRVSRQHTAKVHARVRAAYAAIERLPAMIRNSHYFTQNIEIKLVQTTRDLDVWLAHAEPIIQLGLAEAAQTIVSGHFDIQEYFPNLDIPPPPDELQPAQTNNQQTIFSLL
jgi:hypothetical protein